MTRPDDFPDVEAAVVGLLQARFPDELAPQSTAAGTVYHVNDVAPLVLPGPFFVRVNDIASDDDRITGFWRLDIDVWGQDRSAARMLAERIRTFLLRYPHRSDTVIIDRVLTDVGPTRRPWEDESRHRYGASYRVSARR